MNVDQFIMRLQDERTIASMRSSIHVHRSRPGWFVTRWYHGLHKVGDSEEVVPQYGLFAVEQHSYALFKGLVRDPGPNASLSIIFVGKKPMYSFTAELPTPRYIP